ncbi:unnamed protein product [Caenorhabditis brenneri]
MNFLALLHILLLATSPQIHSAERMVCHVVLECDLNTSCYSLKGGLPFVYANSFEKSHHKDGKKYSMFLARNVETIHCSLLDKYEF